MKPELPANWIGPAMITAGVFGLTFIVHPKAASIALAIVIAWLLVMAVLSALWAAKQADDALGRSEEELRQSAREYADMLRERLRSDEAEVSAAAVIADDSFPARGSATAQKPMGGDRDSADTATPGANFQPAANNSATTARDRKGAPHRSLPL